MAGKSTQLSTQIWNVPNTISALRLILSVVVFVLIPCQLYGWAFWLFAIAAGTDWIDGWWARRFQQVTQVGRILDPFCDKVLICGVFVLLAVEMRDRIEPWYAAVTGWMAVIILARELLVTALRSFIEQAGGDFSAKFAGKVKMWVQCVAAGAAFISLMYWRAAPSQPLPVWLQWTSAISIWAALISTVQSGWAYLVLVTRQSN